MFKKIKELCSSLFAACAARLTREVDLDGVDIKAKPMGKRASVALLVLVALFLCLTVGTVLYFILGPMEGYLHADCTDSLFWAEASLESGKVFDPDYNYAAFLPFSSNIYMIPLLSIFGFGMTAQVISMVIFLLLFTVSLVFMCRSFGQSYTESLLTAAVAVAVLSASEKLREIMWSHTIYYSLCLVLLFFGLGMVARILRAAPKHKFTLPLAFAGTFIFFTLAATNDVQVVAFVTLPTVAALAMCMLTDGKTPLFHRRNLRACILILGLAAATLLGFKLLGIWKGDMSSNYVSIYSSYSEMFAESKGVMTGWQHNLLRFPARYLSLIGVDAKFEDPLFDFKSILNIIRIFAGALILIMPFVLLRNYKKIEREGDKLFLWAHIFVFAFTMFTFTMGRISDVNWRLTPFLATSTVCTVNAFAFLFRRGQTQSVVPRRFAALLTAVVLLFSFVNLRVILKMPADYGRDNAHHELVERLEEENLSYGYAEFWTAQTLTLLSDSEVRTRPIKISSSKLSKNTYQSNKEWFEDQAGQDRYFVCLSESEYNKIKNSDYWSKLMQKAEADAISCAGYMIFIFNENIF